MDVDLTIDAEAAIRGIGDDIARAVAEKGADGVLIGLSGGLDSCVLSAIAVRALGPERVRLAYLFDRDSDPAIARNARLMAESLGCRLEEHDITPTVAATGAYRPLFIRMLRISKPFSRLNQRLYRLLCGENPFKSTLRVGAGQMLRPLHKRLMFAVTMRHVDRGFTERHVFRRTFLEAEAQRRDLVLVGAANRSEFEVGWFVKDGIDDLPFQPMTGLFKTQVRQLGAALGLPDPIRNQAPSPDMAKGITDEFGIGHSYAHVDIVVDALDRGLRPADVEAYGVEPAEFVEIGELMHLSGWKRTSPHEPPPVSGAWGSPLRSKGPRMSDTGEAGEDMPLEARRADRAERPVGVP